MEYPTRSEGEATWTLDTNPVMHRHVKCLPKGFTNNSLTVNRMRTKADTIKHDTLNKVN